LSIVVCDTGPILHLREAGALNVLAGAADVVIPGAVQDELTELIPGWRRRKPRWLLVRRLSSKQRNDPIITPLARELGAGEAEAITLARLLDADWLLTDDAEARAIAQLVGLEAHGSLGVILWGAATGRLGEAEANAALNRLRRSSLWISTTVFEEARRALGKLFE
jgi:predicted nucleic acid-binding protein